jgi:hypothetical protein
LLWLDIGLQRMMVSMPDEWRRSSFLLIPSRRDFLIRLVGGGIFARLYNLLADRTAPRFHQHVDRSQATGQTVQGDKVDISLETMPATGVPSAPIRYSLECGKTTCWVHLFWLTIPFVIGFSSRRLGHTREVEVRHSHKRLAMPSELTSNPRNCSNSDNTVLSINSSC